MNVPIIVCIAMFRI